MGIIREPEGIEFTVISGPYSAEEAAKTSAWIKAHQKNLAGARRKAKRAALNTQENV